MARQFNQEWAEPLTQQESVVVAIGLQITDSLSLPWQDGVSFLKTAAGAGTVVQASFSEDLLMSPQGDKVTLVLQIQIALTDNLSVPWQDGVSFFQTAAGAGTVVQASIVEDLPMAPQKDAVVTFVVGTLLLTLGDNLNQWLDPQFGGVDNSLLDMRYVEALSDTVTLSESLLIGYGDLIAEQIFLQDVSGYGYEPYGQAPFGGFLQNGELLGFGNLITDSLTFTDSVSIGRGMALVDTLTMSDAAAIVLSIAETLTDSLTLSDSILVGYGDLLADTMTLTDSVGVNAGQALINQAYSDALTFSDGLAIGYGDLIADTQTLSDKLLVGPGDSLADTLTLSDAIKFGFGLLLAEQIFLEDINGYGFVPYGQAPFGGAGADPSFLGYGDLVNDALTLTDQFDSVLGGNAAMTKVLADSLTLSDAIAIGYGDAVTDALTLSESLRLGYGLAIQEQIVLVDQVSPAIVTMRISDSLTMSDAFTFAGQFLQLTKVFAEQMFLQDVSGYGFEPYGQAPFGGFLQNGEFLGYGNAVTDLMTLSDSLVIGFPGVLTDSMLQTDSIAIGYGSQIFEPLLSEVQVAQDIFLRANENPLDPVNWAQVAGLTSLQVISNRCLPSAVAPPRSAALYIGASLSPNQYAEIQLERSFQFSGLEIMFRSNAAMTNGYAFGFTDNEDGTCLASISKYVAGVRTVLWNNTRLPFNFTSPPGDVFSVAAIENRLLLYQNGVVVGWVADGTFGSGSVGLTMTANVAVTNIQISSFKCGQIVGLSDQLYIGLQQKFSDQLTFVDSINVFGGFINTLSLSDSLSLTDQLGIEYGLAVTDQLTLSDAFGLFTFSNTITVSDSLSMSDSFSIAINGLRIADSLTLSDQMDFAIGGAALAQSLSDTMTLSDAVAIIVYITQFGDQLVFSDQMQLGYGNVITDQFSFNDVFVKSLLAFISRNLSDQLVMSDAFTTNFNAGPIIEQLSDTLTLSEQLNLEYGNALADLLTISDAATVVQGFEEQLIDTLSLSDSLVVEYGQVLSDTLTMLDAIATTSPVVSQSISDSLSLSDFLAIGYGNQLTDQMVLTDSIAFLFPLATTLADTMTFSDKVSIGYGLSATDQLVLSDAITRIDYGNLIADQLVLSENISLQLLGALISIFPSDQLVMSDAISVLGYGLLPSDQLVLSEQTSIGYGSSVSDQFTLTDLLSFSFVLFQSPSDTLTLSDVLAKQLSMLVGLTDTLTLSEALLFGLGYQIAEQMVLTEGPVLGFGLLLKDQMTPAVDQVIAGYGNTVSDQFTQADQMQFVEDILIQLTDANINQLDAISALFAFGLQVNDGIVFQEQLTLLWGMITGDSLAMADQLNPMLIGPLSLALVDPTVAAWLDAVLTVIVFAPTSIVIEALTVLPQLVADLQVEPQVQVDILTVTKAEV